MPATAGSKILSNFIPPIDSTIAKRWREAGAIIIGKTNMDEFGMGSFNFYSPKIPVNPIDKKLVVGGSSGGAAVAVKTGQGFAALATDTGGSVTFPANCWGIYGFKPSYGRLSRHGVILYSSSNDTPGILANSIEDIEAVFSVIDGQDENDSNWIDFSEAIQEKCLKGLRIGVAKEFNISELPQSRIDEQIKILEILQDQGAEIVEISMPLLKKILPIYYTIIPAEAASNLSRYDGLKYGLQSGILRNNNTFTNSQNDTDNKDNDEDMTYQAYIEKTRTEGFGVNVKRRIILGNFILSTQDVDYNEMFIKAQKIRRLFWHEYNTAMRDIDVMISPNAVWDTPKIDSIMKGEIDPVVGEYSMDYFTVPSNVSGAPAMCLPIYPKSMSDNLDPIQKLPAMYKLWGKYGMDLSLIKASKLIDSAVQSLYKL